MHLLCGLSSGRYLPETDELSSTLVMSLDRSADETLDDACEEHESRHAMSAWESHRRSGDPEATASAVALHHGNETANVEKKSRVRDTGAVSTGLFTC